ncbi:hypothetical protein NO1_0564 [Candidatus Termititenax aidoneus]|uniref:Uncharacterized protein n=1 Tax=Termititenax aidoneus TaxID=2218524 RepID=A0A388TA51_TERA1|nr:hypothetical protein NO1_0564 [Candidatus Termititenax aidoneus]
MGILNNYIPEEPKTYTPPQEGWQRVMCSDTKEDRTKTGKDRVTLDVRTVSDGIEVKYAYSIIGGSEYTNVNLTGVFRAFGIDVGLSIPLISALKNRTAEAYIYQKPDENGEKKYWSIRNFRYVKTDTGEKIETWYPTGKKKEAGKQPAPIDTAKEVFGDGDAPF